MTLTKASFSMINGAPTNVLDYGADKTGATDSTSAIVAALAATPFGGTCYFPAGTYLSTGFNLTSGKNIYGDGIASKLVFNTTGNGITIVSDGVVNSQEQTMSVKSVSFDNGANAPSAFIYNDDAVSTVITDCNFLRCETTFCIENRSSYGIDISACVFYEVTGGGILLNAAASGADAYSYCNRITNCEWGNMSGTGVRLEGGISTYFQSCIWEYIDDSAVQLSTVNSSLSVTFDTCYWEENSGVDLYAYSDGSDLSTVIVTNCVFNRSVNVPNAKGDAVIALYQNSKLIVNGVNGGGGANPCKILGGTSGCSAILIGAANYYQQGSYPWYEINNGDNTVPISFSTAWTTSGTAPSLGNGTLTCQYTKQGNTINVFYELTIGSTTTVGTGNWFFSLPVLTSVDGSFTGTAITAAGVLYSICGAVSGTNVKTNVTASSPVSWATGDKLLLRGSYLI